MMTLRRIPSIVLVAALALPASFGGCILPMPAQHTGNTIRSQQVKKIEPGKTTKQELFALFGAPMGIAVQNEETTILAPTEFRSEGILHRGSYEVQTETQFELFSVRHLFTDYDRVYYYYDASYAKTGYFFLLYIYESGNAKVDRLWVLMNEKTGIVEDYVYREHP
jgi:hypothetical protein